MFSYCELFTSNLKHICMNKIILKAESYSTIILQMGEEKN